MKLGPMVSWLGVSALLVVLWGCDSGKSQPGDGPEAALPSKEDTPADGGGKGTSGGVSAKPEKTLSGQIPAEDDVFLRYYGADPDTLNLITSSDSVSSNFQRQVYESLAQRSYSNPREWEKVLAEDWQFDPENLEYTIQLRKSVKWHPISLPDGKQLPSKELTARDVKFTFDCILNPHIEAASLRSYYTRKNDETGAEEPRIKLTVVDKYTVKIKWTEPYFMADEFTIGAGIMPRHVFSVDESGEPISFDFSSKEFADGFNNHWANRTMCGTGPLIFKEWKKNERVILERNPDYWGAPYYFSKLIYRYVSNPNTARQQVLQNDLDIAGFSEADHYVEAKEHENVKAGKVKLMEYRRTAYRYMGYNLRREVFKDAKVRMALSHAVPVQSIIDEVYHGLAVRSNGPFLPGGMFTNPDIKPVSFDLDEAKKLLDESGWKDSNENGVRDKEIDGKRIEFKFDLMIYSDSPQYLSIAEIIKENFRKIGVDCAISPAKWALMLQKLRKKEFDATILGWVSDWKSDPFQIWHGSQADVPESSNAIGYQNAEVDKLIDKLRITMDEKEQIGIYHEIHRLIFEDQPYTFLYLDKAMVGVHKRIENINFYPMLRPHVDTREWYSSTPRVLGK